MENVAVQFVGNELGQHGPNVYFKEFSVTSNGEKRNYKLGDFYFVQKDPTQPICIAEFQLIWMNLKDGKKLAAVKLYFRPEDTTPGRLAEHGEDELMEADRYILVYCEQMPSWEYNLAIPFGRCVYKGVLGENEHFSKKTCYESNCNCSCYSRDGQRHSHTRTHVKVLSFPAYCRYRATMKLIQSGCSLPYKMMIARGAIDVDCCNTKILFNRYKFQHSNIDDFAMADNIRIPVFKGRPRKRRQSRTKHVNDVKKIKLEKENSNPEANGTIEKIEDDRKTELVKENAKLGLINQTYRIVAPPANCNPERNVIHVKIENKKSGPDFLKIKDVEKEDMRMVMKTNGIAEDSYIAEKENRMCWDDSSIEDGMIGSPHEDEHMIGAMYGMEHDMRENRSPIGESDDEDAPSELVKNGKTGTVLDESFFRKMRNGMRASEGVDKEKMRKILVDACKDVETFKHNLFIFMKQRGTPIVYVPKVGYTRVDLPKLFSLVVANGGYRQVTLNHKWKKVYDEMALATTITSAATCMRRHYEKLLLPFEKYLRIKHRQDALSSKTYSISAQASQPLVLKIKTIKNENIDGSPTTPSTLPTEPEHLQSSIDLPNAELASGCSYNQINIFDCSGTQQTNKPKEKDPFASIPHSAVSRDPLKREEGIFSVSVDATMNKNSLSKSFPWSDKDVELQSVATCRVPVIFPYSKIHGNTSNCLSTTLQTTPSSAVNKNSKKEYLKSDQVSKTVLPQRSATLQFQTSCMTPISSYSFISSSSSTLSYLTSTSVHDSHPIMMDYTAAKVPKQDLSQSEGSMPTRVHAPNIFHQCQNSHVMKKKRGRPPKHAKPCVEVVRFNSSKGVAAYGEVACVTLPSSSPCLAGEGTRLPEDFLRHHQVTIPTPSLGSNRMCTSEAEKRPFKKGSVRMYEYTVKSDSSSAKMVKHQQGTIPSLYSPKDSTIIISRPTISVSEGNFGKQPSVQQVSEVTDVSQPITLNSNIPTHYPRVETVMSYTSKGCLPSTLMKEKEENVSLSKVKFIGSGSKLEEKCTAHNEMKTVQNINDTLQAFRKDFRVKAINNISCIKEQSEMKEEQGSRDKRSLGSRSVIAGPPPLVPIDKRKEYIPKREEELDTVTTEKYPRDSEEKDDYLHGKTNPQRIGDIEQISFFSDIKAVRESFNVDSIIRPLTKTIDRSLAHFRKVAVNEFDKNPSSKSKNGKHDELFVKHREKEGEAKCHDSFRGLHPTNLELRSHDQLKIKVDHSLTPNETEYERNYEASQAEKQEDPDLHTTLEDSNQRLLRIASSDNFEGYSKEVSKHTSQNEGIKTDFSNGNGGQRLPSHYGRHNFESCVSRFSKYGYDFIHPSKQDIVCLSEKCLYSEPILISHNQPSYVGEPRDNLHIRGSQKSPTEKTQEKCILHRDDYQRVDTHGEVHCHRPSYQIEDARHHREAHRYRDSHKVGKYMHDHHSQFVPFYHDNHLSERGFPKSSPESKALYGDVRHAGSSHLSLYHTGSQRSDFSHHGVSGIYAGRITSPVFEHNAIFDTPLSSVRSAWFNTGNFSVAGKDCHGSMSNDVYWNQKVHH